MKDSFVEIVAFIVTYNGMSTGPCIKQCVDFLTADAPPSFGTAIERIDLYPRCQTKDPITEGLEFMIGRFQEGLATLPFIRFHRKIRLFELSYESMWVHSSDMFGATAVELSSSEFNCVCREFAAALALVRRRVKKGDDFDVDAFEAYLHRRVECLNEPAYVESFRRTMRSTGSRASAVS